MNKVCEGGCLCGAVKYTIFGPMRPVVNCHCIQCRKTSGHYVAATAVAHTDVQIIGEVKWFKSSETAKRGFCPECGSNLFWTNGDHLSIHAGTLDGDTGLKSSAHIFTEFKGDYYDITDGLPQFPEYD